MGSMEINHYSDAVEFICTIHKVRVSYFCNRCYMEHYNKEMAELLALSRKQNWVIIFGVDKI